MAGRTTFQSPTAFPALKGSMTLPLHIGAMDFEADVETHKAGPQATCSRVSSYKEKLRADIANTLYLTTPS